MRNFTFYLLGIMLLISATGFAQSISNAGFENWTYYQYFEEPDNFTTTNPYLVMSGLSPNATKTTDAHSGNYALKLQSVETSEDTIFGAAFIGQIGDNSIAGGLPFTQRPDSVTGYAKYDIQFGDTAYLAVLFKKFGAPLGICSLTFIGSESTFAYFSAPVNWFIPIISPDSLVAGFTSSTIDNTPMIGSTITFDDIAFVGTGAAFPNGGFENWTELGADEPNDWTTSNLLTISPSGAGVTKSTDSHSGSFAAKLESKISFNGDSITILTNGTFGDEGPIGGVPLNEFPKTVSGYYKYSPVGPDTALGGLWLYHYDTQTGVTETLYEKLVKLPATSTYTYFEIPVLYYDVPIPDTINISFAPSNYDDGFIGIGSTLWIDDLEITYQPFITGVDEKDQNPVAVYPNPAREVIHFKMDQWLKDKPEVQITDAQGNLVKWIRNDNGSEISVDVNDYPPGLYFYQIKHKGKISSGKFIVK